MVYAVKEIFLTLQGEGGQAGRASVFCRFAGCNLWTGREADRDEAVCRFCDTDFVGTDGENGGKFNAEGLAARIAGFWRGAGARFVVFTGGEPLLQLDGALIDTAHARGFEIAIETNGTIEAPPGIDWVCVSPKAGAEWVLRQGNELKLIFPQPALLPDALPAALAFDHLLLQPMDGPNRLANTEAAVAYCKDHPRWRLSVQTHKMIGIP